MTKWVSMIHATSREALVEFINHFPFRTPVLEITPPCCGERRLYRFVGNIPVNDVVCKCGNRLIKYDYQPLQVTDGLLGERSITK